MSYNSMLNDYVKDFANQSAVHYQQINKMSNGLHTKQVDYYSSVNSKNSIGYGYVTQSNSNAGYGSYGGCVILGNGPSYYTTVRT